VAVTAYQKGSATRLSANFRVREFDCNGKGCCSETKIDDQLVAYLQKIRDHFGAKVTVAAGYRCETHNAQVANAASKSRHILGMAADIKVEGVAPAEVAKYAESLGILGIGLYDTQKDGHFVHIDTRGVKSFWYGHAQEKRQSFGGAQEEREEQEVEVSVLRKGAKGAQVKAMQLLLIGYGFSCGSKGADGSFGPATDKALRAYQTAQGLNPDGICGPKTWGKLLGM
jgi:hypothetical protein